MKKKTNCLIILLFIAILSSYAFAHSDTDKNAHIIANSEDWKDVYSITLYASLLGDGFSFLTNEKHAFSLLKSIKKGTHLHIISSSKVPYIIGYKDIAESGEFVGTDEFSYSQMNFDLAKKAVSEGIKDFIVVDDSLGYSAMAAAPYASIKKSYVLFANKENINDIGAFLSPLKIGELILFGNLDSEVVQALKKHNPQIINKGNRFEDNIEIVKKYLEIKPTSQVVISNGEFIERQLIEGKDPVIFIGSENVPEIIKEFLRNSEFKVAVLIGNELVNTATQLKNELGISTFVKLAQSARLPSGAVAQIENLDVFFLPVYIVSIDLESIRYNLASQQLEITYRNNEKIPVYFKGKITLWDGSESHVVGDSEPVFLNKNDWKTVTYKGINAGSKELTADLFIIFGESKSSLEKILEIKGIKVAVVDVIDACEIKLLGVTYNPNSERFDILVNNIGTEKCYANAEIRDLTMGGQKMTVGSGEAVPIKAGDENQIRIKIKMEDLDIKENRFINLAVYYGQRPNSLTKSLEGILEYDVKKGDILFYSIIILFGILLIGLIIGFMNGRRCYFCNHRNPKHRQKCGKCGCILRPL